MGTLPTDIDIVNSPRLAPFNANDARARLKKIRIQCETAGEVLKMLSANGKLSPSLLRAQLDTIKHTLTCALGDATLLYTDNESIEDE